MNDLPQNLTRFWLWLCRFAYRRLKLRGRLPDGVPSVRDVDAPCAGYSPRRHLPMYRGCRGDGHYLCRECVNHEPERRPLECVRCADSGPLHPVDEDRPVWLCPKCHEEIAKVRICP